KGGVTFAAQPRNYEKKVNRKMYRAAVRSIFSELARQDRLVVVESFDLAEPKTKLMLSALANLGLSRDVLIVSHEVSDALYLASRNLHDVDVRDVEGLDPVSLVGFGQVVVTAPALKLLEEKLA
ncbi:MAG: 50S ribosomal protein L4, partial [Gammaproteobacteria bacterium]|nr:50S ribosomal protein L4 [Gammaproteobacteria bacterium]